MLTVTEGARQYLKELLLVSTDEPDVSVRVSLKPSGRVGLVLGREEEGDQVVEHDGMKVLMVGQELAPLLQGVTLDVQDTADGPKLVALEE